MTPPTLHPGSPREVRFGLVLYGGVSLAVYIYGVVLEFERLIRASQGVEENAWTEVLREAGVTATVDIISGASAGGINGVLLGKALATGAELRSVRSLWIDEGDIDRLLRDTGEKEPASLLNSDRFRELLEGGLEAMDEGSSGTPLVGAFDLFIAGTRIQPWIRRFPTDLGGSVRAPDYRKSFNLKLRRRGYNREQKDAGYDRNDFGPDHNGTLADVAQATSAFPGAFEPPLVSAGGTNEQLFLPDEPEASYFSDGGILQNKPFTQTIATIFTRAAAEPVDRWLVSVEPDPERIARLTDKAVEPTVAEVAAKALVGIPRYQSIATDLERLREHRSRVRLTRQKLSRMDEMLLSRIDELKRSEAGDEAVLEWQQEVLAASDYERERRRGFRRTLAERLAPPAQEGAALEAGRTAPLVSALEESLDVELHRAADADYERRRIYHLLEMTRTCQNLPELRPEARESLAQARLRLWGQFDRIEELLWEHFQPEADWRRDDGDLAEKVAPLLVGLGIGLRVVAKEVQAICESIDRALYVDRGDSSPRFTRTFEWFELWDAQLLTIAEVSSADARDEIRFARISPADAKFIDKRVADKLSGDSLGHFGGFLKKSWRENDLLWGRLDAAELICRMIMRSPGGGPAARLPEKQIRAVQEEIARAEIPNLTGDYRAHMEHQHSVGEEKFGDIPMEKRADLGLRSAQVLRNMFRGLGNAKRGPEALRQAFTKIGRWLGLLLGFLRWPIQAIYGRDPAWRRTLDIAILFIGLWGAVSLILVLLGAVAMTDTLRALIALSILLFLAWSLLHAFARRIWPISLIRRIRRARRR
jgi:predicted acylesterase/phospholipase RssA